MIGHRFGNYTALSLLGEGGMGVVYLAEHPEIGRRVAVKVLRSDLGRDPDALARFLNEARAANAIRHPNIIEILDSGTTSDGASYLVMELLEGEALRARLSRSRVLSVRDALEITYQTASALGAAHAKGIIHRDLKPDNLFLVPEPLEAGRERVKVLDFGIAKLQIDRSASSVRTRTGTLMGTPVYMSPEQCLGTKVVDLRTDVYALGIILFEMLCGAPPYVSEGLGELVNMHLNAPVPSVRDRNADVPDAVAALVSRMLAKKPEERPASMIEVQAAVRSAAGSSVVLRGLSSPRLEPGGTALVPEGAASPTTLSRTAGEREAPPFGRRSAVGRGALAAVAGLTMVLAGWMYTRTSGTRGSSPVAPVGAPANEMVQLRVASTPDGAAVTGDDGAPLGVTPLLIERRRAASTIRVRLARAGYVPVVRTLNLDRNGDLSVDLQPEPPVALPATAGPGRGAAGGASGNGPGQKAARRVPRRPSVEPVDPGPAKL